MVVVVVVVLSLICFFLLLPSFVVSFQHFPVSELTVLAEWWSGTDCQLVVEEGEDLSKIGQEHAIVIMNHKYDIDWLMGWIMANRFGVLGVGNHFLIYSHETVADVQ